MTTATLNAAYPSKKSHKALWTLVGVIFAPFFLLIWIFGSLFGAGTSGNGNITPITPRSINAGNLDHYLPLFEEAGNADGYASLPPSVQQSIQGSRFHPCVLPWELIAAIADIESNFNSKAHSFAGAMGMMQYEPGVFNEYSNTVGLLSPPGGTTPPSAYSAADAIYAADLTLCSDGATSNVAWSAGDTRAVGIYNCGGNWIYNPGACVTYYHGKAVDTTVHYVSAVEGVFLALQTRYSSTSTTLTPPQSPNSNTSTTTTVPHLVVTPNDPFIPSTVSSAQNLVQVHARILNDANFMKWVFHQASDDAGLQPSLQAPTSMSQLSQPLSKYPVLGAITSVPNFSDILNVRSELGVVVGLSGKTGAVVAYVKNGHVVTTTIKSGSYGLAIGE